MAFCTLAVAALAVGPFLYRSLLPEPPDTAPTGCSFVVVVGGLLALLIGATIWQLRRRREPRQADLDRRLWEAALGEEATKPPRDEGETAGGRPQTPAG